MYYCTMPVPDREGGGLGARAPTPHEEAAVSVLKNFFWGGVWGVLGWFGVFRGSRFPKKKFSALYVSDGLGGFG